VTTAPYSAPARTPAPAPPASLRLADYVAEFVRSQGVPRVFMLSGTGSIHMDDAFANHPELGYATARHEGAAVVMASGLAQITGGLGVVLATTGPGGINAITGVTEAWVDSVPLMVITGQAPRRHLASTRYFGIQGFNVVDAVGSFTKYAAVVMEPESIRYHLERAAHAARSGRPGPVWLDIPADIQAAMVDPGTLRGYEPGAPEPDELGLALSFDEIVAMLRGAERPLLVLGGGVKQARALPAFRQLAERTGAPVVATRFAQDQLSYGLDWYFGLAGIRGRRHTGLIMRGADCVLGLGTSLAHGFIGEDFDGFGADTRIALVNLDPAELSKPGAPIDVPVRADVRVAIAELLERLAVTELPDYTPWMRHCRELKDRHPTVVPAYMSNPINSYHFVECLERQSSPRSVFVSDAGSSYYITGQALRFEDGRRQLTSGAYASMGIALPLAIGASFADPAAQVLVVTGDGSIELNIQELRTVSQYGLGIKVFVINNGGYASIRDSQDAMCGGRYTDDQDVLDFEKVAAAFDLRFHLLDRFETLDEEIRGILDQDGPALIEVVCDTAQEMLRPISGPSSVS
jgi:acetolactate synthase-1/2/3 large subunit